MLRAQVAKCIVAGIRAGKYHLPSPDAGQNLVIAAMTSFSPRPLPLLLELFLIPIVRCVMAVLTWRADRVMRRYHAGRLGAGC